MLIVITNPAKNIIYKGSFSKTKNPIDYFLIYAALDTQEDLQMDGRIAKSKLFPSGHRLLIAHKAQDKIPRRFIELIDQFFIEEMMNPYVDDNEVLSSKFSENVEDAFNKTMLKVDFSI